MEKISELKKLIAAVLGVNEADINEATSLRVKKLKTSAGSVILSNMVKRVYNKKVDCKKVLTFGELLSRIDGGADFIEREGMEVNSNNDDQMRLKADRNEDSSNYYTSSPFLNFGGFVCGIDIQEIDIFPEALDYWTDSFYIDNFTKEEIAYCITTSSPRHSFAARWCIKEALHKCGEKFFNIPLADIQVVKHPSGLLSLETRSNTDTWEILPFSCSISHADNYAVGMVIGIKS